MQNEQEKKLSKLLEDNVIRSAGYGPICPYCGSVSVLCHSIVVYDDAKYPPVWICTNYPKCNTYVGCREDTYAPHGTLANEGLRKIRRKVHQAFDPFWKKKKMTRGAAYERLAKLMDLPTKQAHIGLFDMAQCKQAIEIINAGKFLDSGTT